MIILAHRGASGRAPENTMAAFALGLELGADGIEFDLRRSRDGEIVVIHDATLDRTSDGHGAVADTDWAELARLDAGSWFAPRFAGERLIRFSELLAAFGNRPIHLAVELKAAGIEEDVLAIIAETPRLATITVTSFEWENLRRMRAVSADMRLGYLTAVVDERTVERVLSVGAVQICPDATTLTLEQVQLARAHALEVRGWNSRPAGAMENAVALGLDGLTVDHPDRLLARLRRVPA